MKKILIFILIFIVCLIIFVGLYPPVITPPWRYDTSKDQRLKIINRLKENCSSEDVTYLISTYRNKFEDVNTTKCWREYMDMCQERQDKKLSLKIPINCQYY